MDLNRSPYQPLLTNLLEFVEEGDHAADRLRATRSTGVENAYKLDILVRDVHLQHFSINVSVGADGKTAPETSVPENHRVKSKHLREWSNLVSNKREPGLHD